MEKEKKTTKTKEKNTASKATTSKVTNKKSATKAEIQNTKTAKKVKVDSGKFAVISISGEQVKVQEGRKYEIKKIEGKKGDKIDFDKVLLTVDGDDVKVGTPDVKGAKVSAEILAQTKGKKLKVFKYKAKARYRKTYGSRQHLTQILINKISS